MNIENLRKLLEESNDKLKIFEDVNILREYSFSVYELIEIIKDFLNDEQKAKLFELEHFKKLDISIKKLIINVIKDENIKLNVLINSGIAQELKSYEIVHIVKSLSEEFKIQMLYNIEFIKKCNVETYYIKELIEQLNDENKIKILEDKDFVLNKLQLKEYEISALISQISTEEKKLEMIELYEITGFLRLSILDTMTSEYKIKMLSQEKEEFNEYEIIHIISKLNIEEICNFIRDNRGILEKNNISIYRITRELTKKEQLEFISKLEDMELSLEEKRQILVTLDEDVKEEIDVTNFPPEYIKALSMKTDPEFSESYGKIIVDFAENLESYRGLDELIYMNPLDVEAENKEKILRLCEICPEIKIKDNMGLSFSSAKEYIDGEKWIESVLGRIDESWSDIQKIAFIDNAIGKRISYCPDFNTEVFKQGESRTLWKIIESGYGVCNGIAQVEQYILSKIGIEAEMVNSSSHSFLKLKNVEIPNEQGGMAKGDTILDPTWNLTAHRYGAKPSNFCRSYEKIREHDIRSDGVDVQCHKNDEELSSATLDLDEKSLRKVFSSIGLADKNGDFPIKKLIDESKIIDDFNLPEEESVRRQLLLLTRYCPEFAECQNSTTVILEDIILNQKNLNFNKCVINRVYERKDEEKRPVLYVYIDFPESGKKFYFADGSAKQFLEVDEREFESRFECYETDIALQNGIRPWESTAKEEKIEDLTKSSGKVVASEGDER